MRSYLLAALLIVSLPTSQAAEPLHFLIPAGPGGGLDSTARGIGRVLQDEGLRSRVSYENMSGGGGGRAMSHFVETAPRQHGTLLVNSTPLLVRSLQGLLPHTHRDLIPLAGLIADAGMIAVRADAGIQSWRELVEELRTDPRAHLIGGGSVRGSLDHIVFSLAASKAGIDPRRIRYLPYDGGGKAMLALLGGEIEVLSSGVGETLGYVASGDIRVLAITAELRNPKLPEVPTLTELGVDLVFANWRGLFAAPGIPADEFATISAQIEQATTTSAWKATLARYGWMEQTILGEDFQKYLDDQESMLRASLELLGMTR